MIGQEVKVFFNGRVLTPWEQFYGGVVINGTRFETLFRGAPPKEYKDYCSNYDAGGGWIVPGFIDLHLHGALGMDFNRASTGEVDKILRFHGSFGGSTAVVPTILSAPEQEMRKAVHTLKQARSITAVPEILGIHLEGPLLNPVFKGAHPEEYLCPGMDIVYELVEEAGGDLAMVTLAPELKGAGELIKLLAARGVVCALGHSGAGYEEVAEAVSQGLSHAVHVYSAMGGFHHRRPGTLGAVLSHDEISAEIIADGVHVHPALVKLFFRAKGLNRAVLATDASSAAGLLQGRAVLGGEKISIKKGAARLVDGTLAGSLLTMNRALAGALKMAGLSMEEAVAAATINPARVLGVEGRKGSLEEGKDADLVILDSSFNVVYALCRGRFCSEKD